MAGISMADVQNLREPAMSWRYLATLPSLPALVGGDTNNDLLKSFRKERQAPSAVRVEGIEAPHYFIVDEQEFYAGGVQYFPVSTTNGDINLVLYESIDFDALAYINHWMNLVVDLDGNYGLPIVYRKQIIVNPLDTQGNKTPSYFVAKDCWPTNINSFQFGSNCERLSVNATFKVGGVAHVFADSAASAQRMVGP